MVKKIIQKIFSIKRKDNNRKQITILGLKISYKSPKKISNRILLAQIDELTKTVANIDFKQNLVMDYFMEAKEAKQATGNLRKFQKQDIELLKEFLRICDKHNLRYWLDFGSLLGAVRHKGFVPWDDDCDVSMPESDFIKLQELIENEIDDTMKYLYWVKGGMGRFVFKKDKLNSFLDIYCYEELDNAYQFKMKVDNIHDRAIIPANILFPTNYINFEGMNVKCPNDYDTYLRIRYGNYEVMPKSPHIEDGHVFVNEYIDFYEGELK